MATAQFTRRFSAAHRLANDGGPCNRIHGHNYEAEIIVESNILGENNMVIPADRVKAYVDLKYDHRLILSKDDFLLLDFTWPEGWVTIVDSDPSTEYLAQKIAEDVGNATWGFLLSDMPNFVHTTCILRETPTIRAIGSHEITHHDS
jgi:6-pyruvoyl-tetrahydropterin synthase